MEGQEKKCSNEEHKEAPSFYCQQCKLYMCKKCQTLHSKLFKGHNELILGKNEKEIFTGFCQEQNHFGKLDYYCKKHNKLCCSDCISKIKSKEKAPHKDCDVCEIEEIKEEKNLLLKKHIKDLEELSKKIEGSINELKAVFENINKNKEELKLKLQKIFTEIRNKINEREDELLLEIDKLYEETYISENIVKEMGKFPKKIKLCLEKGQSIDKEWENKNKLSEIINGCINIENNLSDINNKNQLMEKCKNKNKTFIKFYPEEAEDLNRFFSEIKNFGKLFTGISINNKEENGKGNELTLIEINTMEIKEPNGIFLELKGIDYQEYLKYFEKEVKFEENEIAFTIFLEGKTKENLDIIFDICDKSPLKNIKDFNFSIRKEKDKLLLEFKFKSEYFNIIKFLYNFDYDLKDIIIKLNNKLDFNKITKMSDEEFCLSFFSNILFLKLKHQSLEKFKKSLEKVEKEKEKEININDFNFLKRIIDIVIPIKSLKFNLYSCEIYKSLLDIFNIPKYESDNNLKELLNLCKKLLSFMNDELFKDLCKYIRLDNFLITTLFKKYETAFILSINSKGLPNIVQELLYSNNK